MRAHALLASRRFVPYAFYGEKHRVRPPRIRKTENAATRGKQGNYPASWSRVVVHESIYDFLHKSNGKIEAALA